MNLFPLVLNVAGRRCVVVGGGAVAERKTRALLDADARVEVVAPALKATGLMELVAAGRVCHVAAPFMAEHLDGETLLVIAATDQPNVNAAVAKAARSRCVLVNLAAPAGEDPNEAGGDFVTMATVRRGDLLVALTTGGAGPALAARLRRELDEHFGPEWAAYVALLGEMRGRAKQTLPDEPARTAALRRLAGADHVRQKLADGDAQGARQLAQEVLEARL
jgi:precorrin-2 dehydrogenase/sirohydrochlorin ferrochelatase